MCFRKTKGKNEELSSLSFFCFLLFYLLLLAYSSAGAQEPQPSKGASLLRPSSAQPEPQPSPRWQWSFSLRNRTGFRLNEPRRLQLSRTFLDAKGIYKLNDTWRLSLEGRAHFDPIERLGYPKKVWFDLRQLLFDGKLRQVSLSLGLQQVVWGQADGLRVLDVINPLDYREFILEEFLDSRRPLWTVRAEVPIGQGSWQLLWVPYFASGRLPGPEDEFGLGPSFGLGLLSAASGNQPPIPIKVEPTGRPPYQLKSSQFGVRYRRSVGSWDLTANYFYGWEDTPTPYLLQRQDQTVPPSQLTFAPRHDRKEVFGATAATNFGPVVLRLEAGWSRNKATAVTESPPRTGFRKFGQFASVVGLDYEPRSWVWLSGQYFLQLVSAPEHTLLFPRYSHLASIFVRTNFFRDTFRPELFILTGLNERQYLIRPRLRKNFGDHWSVGLGADFLGGRSRTPFGFFDSRDRLVIELKWQR